MASLYNMAALLYIILPSTVLGYPYKVQVSKITSSSVSLNWESTELLVQEFIIHCSGTQYYQTADGEVHNSDMHVRLQHVPKGLDHVIIGGLRPNYNYTCTIDERVQEGAQVFDGQLSKPVVFCTDYAAPQEPKVPTIFKEGGVSYITLNKPESSKSGPITGYVIQFHLIPDSSLSDVPLESDYTEPFGKLSPINFDFAQVTSQPVSFQIKFEHDLPKHLQIGRDLMKGALKNGAVYRVVTVAYIKCKDSTILFTASQPSISFVAVGLDQAAADYNETIPSHVKFVIVAGILLPLLCLMYMCCISIVLLCREHYLALKYDQLDTRSCIRRSLDCVRRRLLIMYLVCSTFLSHCKKCKKGFNALPLSDDEIFNGSQEKTFDSNLGKKSSRVNKVIQKRHPSKRYHSTQPMGHLHHYKPGHSSAWNDTDRVKDQLKTDKYYHKSVSSKRTCENTKAHGSEKHQTPSHSTRVGREKQGIEKIRLPSKVLTRPLVGEIKKDRFPVPSKSHSIGSFSHHHSSRFRPSREHSGSQDALSFKHQPLPGRDNSHSQYGRENSHITVQQPTKSHLQHSSDVLTSTRQEPVKSAAHNSAAHNSEQSSRRIFQSRLPHDSEGHSLKYTTKSNTQHAKRSDRDLSHYQQHFKSSASESHHHKMQRDQSIIESSGGSISPEEIGDTQALHYTTRASVFERPFSSATERYYSPFEFNQPSDEETLVSTSTFTRSSNSTFIPICSTTDKINILSSTENFDVISLFSSTTQAGDSDDSVMDVLH